MLEETFAKLINGQFFVVYRNHASRKRNPLLYKLDGDFIPHQAWLDAMVAAATSGAPPACLEQSLKDARRDPDQPLPHCKSLRFQA